MSGSQTTFRSGTGRLIIAIVAGFALATGLMVGATAAHGQPASSTGEAHPEGVFGTEQSSLPTCSYTGRGLFGANVREEPRMTANTLGRILSGEEVRGDCTTQTGGQAVGCDGLAPEDQWVKVSFKDQDGWVMSSCLQRHGLF